MGLYGARVLPDESILTLWRARMGLWRVSVTVCESADEGKGEGKGVKNESVSG